MYIKGELTYRQKKMVDEYLICGNKSKAAEIAGFKKSYAQGAFKQEAVKKYLAEKTGEISENENLKNQIYNLTLYLDYCINHMTQKQREKLENHFDFLPGFDSSILQKGDLE